MADDQADNQQDPRESDGGLDRDLILDLNFVPSWARKPPTAKLYGAYDDDAGPRRRDSKRPRNAARPDRDRPPRSDRRPPARADERRRPREQGEPAAEPARVQAPARHDRYRPPEEDRPTLPPITVRFLPEQRQLAALIRQIAASRRAYPLMDLATFLLNQPGGCFVRFQVRDDARDCCLYQCKYCRSIALDEAEAMQHLLQEHVDEFFTKETVTGEAAAGNFVCVARCGLSNVLLGPPNHHSYAEKVREVHAARYPDMSLDDYRARITMSHQPEDIERWKLESATRTVYRLKNAGEAAAAMTWGEAETYLRQHAMGSAIVRTKRAAVPEPIARKITERGLRAIARNEWQHEQTFPLQLSFALRAAFRHKHLAMFKAGPGKGINFVTAVQPAPLDPTHAIDSIRDVLVFLQEHPGCTREQLVESLRPGADTNSEEGKHLLAPLYWLIDRGHIIEFFNGTLSVPLSRTHDAPSER